MAVPKWVQGNATWREHWEKPWLVDVNPRKAAPFKKALWRHGYLSPHFKRAEGASRSSRFGVQAIPEKYRVYAQRYCFVLERVRHELGRPLAWLDMYRSPAHNDEVGGATASEHVFACAADWPSQPNQHEFDNSMRRHYYSGGIGSGAVTGRVMHTDTGCRNGGPRRWTYPGA